ncbi:hypothetical protein J4E82_000711 [Alternaria postmessia]|uniref:uncharacterized protein n=1 Tax=Alternaria postmessia TaxID=1187938 RepID=UPI00222580D7|nr:uncharacterized protein J4E82_000711 [Alternaria postmessia]KAI5380753.1 hypothetical protein J4E82_000711 [Alternaria postmessia]
MAGHATITFSQTGVQPPVYVTTSINDWTPVEMDVNEDKTASDNLIFRKEFNDVAEGSYQYKIRVGEDHWVLDESKETAATDDGIRNNVIHVKVASENNSLKSAPEATTVQETPSEQESLKASLADPSKIPEDRKDSTMGDQLSSVPVSSMVVDKVEDQKQPAYGNTHHLDLPVDAAKRSADAEPDYEETKVDSPIKTETPKSPEIPLLVVDKTDDRPAYGDDFGEDATTAQKVAHDMRASDTQPDILTITPESHTEPGDTEDDQAAPLFRHESFQADDESQAPPKITVDDESTQSSTDQTSSGDAMDTPPEPEDGDELNLAPLLSHETELRGSVSEARDGLQVSHEGNDDEDDVDDSGGAPLLPHETGFTEDDGADTESDDERNELDRYPLLSHESGFSDYKRSETLTKSEHSENREPQHYGAYGNEDEDEGNRDAEDDDTPLLPHERESAFVSSTGSDFSQDDAPFSLEKQPTFGYETDNARELFGAADRHDFFRGRTGSNLPHRLPQSDAEDQDLNDPSLERFPTNRESILARVATIGMHLPEDESMHERPHSPQPSVLSQACSSIDLVPVKSYASLASVPEDENSDEDEGYHHDLDSMPSPVYISHNTTRRSSPPARFVRDPYAASLADDNEKLGDAFDTKIDEPGSHTQESSEAESVAKHDGAKDISVAHSALLDAISAPVNMAKSATELVTSEPKTTTSEAHPVSNLDSELRQRRAVLEESSQTEEEMPESTADDVSITDKIVEAAKPALAQRSDYRRDNFLQHLFRAMFAACFGDRKRAR